MGPVIEEVTIDVPRERVFAVLSDLSARPSFCDHFMTQYRLQRVDPVGVGATARFHVAARGFPVWMETVIAELEAPYLIVERGGASRQDRMPVGTAWELTEIGGTTTNVRLSFWTEPSHPVDRMKDRMGSAGWYRRQWRRALTRLRDMLEEQGTIERVEVGGASRI